MIRVGGGDRGNRRAGELPAEDGGQCTALDGVKICSWSHPAWGARSYEWSMNLP